MKETLSWVLLLCWVPFLAHAQTDARPFSLLDQQVSQQQGGWAGSKEDLSKVFNAERIRLGDRFEKVLLEYVMVAGVLTYVFKK